MDQAVQQDAQMRNTAGPPGATPAPTLLPPQPFQPSQDGLNPFQCAIHGDLAPVLAETDKTKPLAMHLRLMQRLETFGGRLGATRSDGWTRVASTTVRAMLDIKKMLADPSLPDTFRRVFDKMYRPHLEKLAWRFEEAFEMINFLSAYGRDDMFGTKQVSFISIPVIQVSNDNGYFQEASLVETISRLRRQLFNGWKEAQTKRGWQSTRKDHWPPDDRNFSLPIRLNGGEHTVTFRCSLRKHEDGFVVHWAFIGQLAALI
ncbi:hypothetical protein LTR85_008475 [Meristemomyces frigidus]|nr:hypothetical protein LTR85_008475 [Meristemomyces frigidus]